MTEWIITSGVLIVVVIILRTVLKGKISLRLQYALWALVLVRLLIPGSLFGSALSVMNAVPNAPVGSYQEEPGQEVEPPIISAAPATPVIPSTPAVPEIPLQSDAPVVTLPPVVTPEEPVEIPWGQVLRMVWYAGMAVMALWLIVANLRFYLRLTRSREIVKYASPALYTVQGIETPCLFGLFHPSVYVTPEVAEDKGALAHVLAHEETHYHHKDHIWALLRCICLVVHWYNPLVWLAAALSRRDSELACDEGAIRRLGEEQRAAYGRTLIGLTCTGVGGLLRTATTMTGSKKSIKERIVLIARKPKMKLYTLVAVILIAVIAAGCTFTGQSMDFPGWVSTITLEDLDSGSTGEGDGGASLNGPGIYRDMTLEERQELLTILQGIKRSDFTTRDPGLTEYRYHISVHGPYNGGVRPNGWWSFTCLSDGMLKVECLDSMIAAKYGFREVQYLDCPELYSFIIRQMESDEPSEEQQGTGDEVVDSDQLLEDYARETMKTHAAELTSQMNYSVSAGWIEALTPWRSEVAGGSDVHIDVMKVDYYLIHQPDGRIQNGSFAAYSRFMFLLYQGESVILLGHMDETTVANVYSTPEMLDQYGDAFVAAAVGLHKRYLVDRAYNMAILSTPNAVEGAFFDLNGDGWAEFVIKSGTGEADYVYTFYAYRNGVQGAEPIGRVDGRNSYLAVHNGYLVVAGHDGAKEWATVILWEEGRFSEELYRRSLSGEPTEYPNRVLTLPVAGDVTDSAASEAERLIKERYITYRLMNVNVEPEPDKIQIVDYYGQFGDGYAAIVASPWFGVYPAVQNRTVDGVTFHYPDSRQIELFCADGIYTLEEAFAAGLLIHEDLVAIALLHNSRYQAAQLAAYSDPVEALSDMMNAGGLTVSLFTQEELECGTYALTDGGQQTRAILNVYSWTLLDEAPIGGPRPTTITISAADGAALIFKGDYACYEKGNTTLWWQAGRVADTDYTLTQDVRWSVYDPLEFHWSNVAPFEADGPKAAADQFALLYGQHLMSITPGSTYRALDHDIREVRVCELSTDKQAIMAEMTYYVLPEGEHSMFMVAGAQDGTGKYEGWVSLYRQFVLEQGVDGLWRCLGFGTGGYQLSSYGYENGLWGAIYGNPQAYRCKETDPQKAAEKLIAAYVADLTKPDEMRSFTITDYRNIEVYVIHTLEMSEADRSSYNYGLKDTEIGENHWIVEFTMEYRWIGVLHDPPAGPGDSMPEGMWLDQTGQGSPVGFLLTREGDEFILQSRYSTRK